MTETSDITLAKKLGIKPGHTVIMLHAPQSVIATLGAELRQVHLQQTPGSDADIVHFFAANKQELSDTFPSLVEQIARHGALWISWPKGSSGMETDLSENAVRDVGIHHNMVDVKVSSIDEIWSGLKFVYRLKDR